MKLFVHGPRSPGPLNYLERRDASKVFETFLTGTTRPSRVVVLNNPGLDAFAKEYFACRGVPVAIVPQFRSQSEQMHEVCVNQDIDYALIAAWAKDWQIKLDMLEIPHTVLWSPDTLPEPVSASEDPK